MQVGSQKRIKLDIRIIASFNKDLREAIKAGTFPEDLYYRLSVVPIHLPPCGSGLRTSLCWRNIFSESTPKRATGRSKASLPRP